MKIVKRPVSIPAERLEEIAYYEGDEALEKIKQLLEYAHATVECIRYHKKELLAEYMTIDTETTTLTPDAAENPTNDYISFDYLYQIRFLGTNFILRTRFEFRSFFDIIGDFCHQHDLVIVGYVHNLSFEYAFFRTQMPLDKDGVFALQSRRIGKCSAYDGHIELRCSYLLSNMSLEKFAQNYAPPAYQKDKELIDYEVIRWPWDPLTDEILYYSLMDVIALDYAIRALMEREGDNLKTIPMTNTGYVRRVCRRACLGTNIKHYRSEAEKAAYRKFYLYRRMFTKTQLTYSQYQLLCDAFRGGNTHANRFFAGRILPDPEDEPTIGHVDFASSYPAQLICSDEFPMGRLMECTNSLQTLAAIDRYCRDYWVVIKAVFLDAKLKNPYRTKCPYIPVDKVKRQTNKAGTYDNGRIIEQPGGMVYCFLGIEWPIIKAQYSAKIKVIEAYYCPKGRLPLQLRQVCFDWYEAKTRLKGVEGSEYEYMKSKNRVNSVYGMMVEHIIKEIMMVQDDLTIKSRKATQEEGEDQLTDFYTPMKQKFLAFQWGVTITALARAEHMRLVAICGDDFLYGDTDSVFFLNPSQHAAQIESYNETWKQYAASCGCGYKAYTKKGEEQILGLADWEPSPSRFVTLGAKKYAMIINGKLEITVAGVPKKAGAALLGDIRNFKPGFTFYVGDGASADARRTWKKTLHYHDDTDLTITVSGHILRITSGIAISRAPYELDITPEYTMLTGYEDRYIEDDIY